MKSPNFFIAGAPRCGTTSLYSYLSEHPNIFMSELKELHYFADDFYNIHKIVFKNEKDYLKVFSKADAKHIAVGEASPFYMFSKTAMRNIYSLNPNARIIIALRNPVDFVHSLHQLNLSLLREDERDLKKAWDLEGERMQGRNVPASARHVELLMYSQLGQFGKYVSKVFGIFPKNQVKVVLFEELQANTHSVYEDILDFLDVPSDGRTDFPQINAGFANRSPFFAKLLHPPQPVYRAFIAFTSLFGVDFMKNISLMYNRVEKVNTSSSKRLMIEPKFRAFMLDHFKPDIHLLSEIIGRDLSPWLKSDL